MGEFVAIIMRALVRALATWLRYYADTSKDLDKSQIHTAEHFWQIREQQTWMQALLAYYCLFLASLFLNHLVGELFPEGSTSRVYYFLEQFRPSFIFSSILMIVLFSFRRIKSCVLAKVTVVIVLVVGIYGGYMTCSFIGLLPVIFILRLPLKNKAPEEES